MIKYDMWKILKIPELGFTPPVLSALLESKEVAPGRAKLVGIGTIIGIGKGSGRSEILYKQREHH